MNKLQLFKPHKGQEDIINGFVIDKPELKWAIITTGRQFGKTLLGINSMIYWLWNNPGSKGGWVSPIYNQTKKVMEDLYGGMPDLVSSINRMDGRIVFKNGSELIFLSATNSDGIRGFTFDYLIVDEAAFIDDKVMSTVLRPTVAVKGKKVMLISTPWIKNWFYEYFQLGLSEDEKFKEYVSFKASSLSNPHFPMGEIEAARQTTSEEIIKQEYYAEFSDNAGGVFLGFENLLSVDEYQGSSDDVCYMGVDIALGGKDMTCVAIMDGSGKIINIERWKESITEKQIKDIIMIADAYNIKRGFIEMNQERGIQQAVSKQFPQIRPWETTRKNKPVMIQNLKKDIEDGILELPSRTLDHTFFHEFSNFTYEKKKTGYIEYSHPPNGHDDTIIAVALANEARLPNRHTRRSWIKDFERWNG